MMWQVNNPSLEDLVYLSSEMLVSRSILSKFLDHIHIVSHPDGKDGNKNIGFPFSIPGSNNINGYQLVNYNFNEVIINVASTQASWNVNFKQLPENIDNMYIFGDPIDLMSYCEIYTKKINFEFSAFCCIQKNISDIELSILTNFFPRAKIHTGFNYDWQGNLLDIRTAVLKNYGSINIQKVGTLVTFEWKQKLFQLPVQDLNFARFRALTNVKSNIKVMKAHNALNFSSQLMRLKNSPKSIFRYNYEEI